LFAALATIVLVLSLVFGMRLPVLLIPPALIVSGLVQWRVNRHAVERMGDVPPSGMPGFRLASAVAVGLVVALATTFWWFDSEIEAARRATASAAVQSETQRIEDETRIAREILARPWPVAEQDHEVLRLERQLDEQTKELGDARRNVLCEEDGTCGTRVRGRATEYYAKVAYRDQVQHSIDDLARQLDDAKAAVNRQLKQFDKEQAEAKARISRGDRPAPASSAPIERTSRFSALLKVADQRRVAVGLVSTLTLAFFALIDCLAILLTVRLICRREDGPVLNEELLTKRGRKDARRRQGAKSYDEYTASKHEEPLAGEAGE
jgi:hypothetical protein